MIQGKVFYSYEKVFWDLKSSIVQGARTILNDKFEIIHLISREIDPHEFHLIDLDHYVVLEAPSNRLKSGITYSDRRIREYDHGQKIFDWGLSDFMEELGWPAVLGSYLQSTHSETVTELMHLNSFQLIDKNRMLVSLGSNGIVCLDRQTKKILWVFGGLSDEFGLTFDEQLPFIHTPSFNPSTKKITVFKNSSFDENREVFTPATVVEYELDLEHKKVIHSKVIRNGGEITVIRGSVQVTGQQVYSINYGTNDMTPQNTFVERQGDKDNMSIQIKDKNIEVYRIYRQPFGIGP